MVACENVLKTDFSAYGIRTTCRWVNDTTKATGDDRAVALIRELLRGNIAGIRRSADKADSAVSMLQKFDAAAAAVNGKLAQMEQLADKAANGYCTENEKALMQKDVKTLAEEINKIVKNTHYEGNKLFTAGGKTISITAGDGSDVHIFAKDLSFNTAGLDLAANARASLSRLRTAMANTGEYCSYLSRQTERLENTMTALEYKFGQALGVESSDFDTDRTEKVLEHTAVGILANPFEVFQAQANVMPARAIMLLEYKGACS
jgi:flagellin